MYLGGDLIEAILQYLLSKLLTLPMNSKPAMFETGVSYISVLACSPLQTRSSPGLRARPSPAVSPILIAYRSEKSTICFFSSSEKAYRLESVL